MCHILTKFLGFCFTSWNSNPGSENNKPLNTRCATTFYLSCSVKQYLNLLDTKVTPTLLLFLIFY